MPSRRFCLPVSLRGASGLLCALVLAPLLGCDDGTLTQIPEPGQISGRVCDPGEGRGLEGAFVFVELGAGSREDRITTQTDAEGRFLLEEVPIGTYTVHVERGSFRTALDGVLVEEETLTALDEEECLAPDQVSMIVFDGHDDVQAVLNRLGYSGFEVIDTHHEWEDRDENTPSWVVEAFADPTVLDAYDIVFINCAAHEWALQVADPGALEQAAVNLRRFVAEGGSLYLSDWSYDLLELLYPDAVDWAHDDTEENAAEVGLAQDFLATVTSDELQRFLQLGEVFLRYELNRIAVPRVLGPGSTALLLADIQAEGEVEDEEITYQSVPVLLEHRPTVLGVEPEDVGRVIFTTFHNGSANTRDMDEVLRAIVFSL